MISSWKQTLWRTQPHPNKSSKRLLKNLIAVFIVFVRWWPFWNSCHGRRGNPASLQGLIPLPQVILAANFTPYLREKLFGGKKMAYLWSRLAAVAYDWSLKLILLFFKICDHLDWVLIGSMLTRDHQWISICWTAMCGRSQSIRAANRASVANWNKLSGLRTCASLGCAPKAVMLSFRTGP